MKLLTLDAEYNQPSRKTIQIGAAVFDARSGALMEKMRIYVNPQEPISPEIVELTGVTDQDVSGGMSILEAYEELGRLHKKWDCFRNPLVWGSGVRNDSTHICEEAGVKLDDNFMGFRVIDVKTIFQSMAIFENTQYAGGLKETCEKRLNIGFEGSSHDALDDAINTFRVWYHLMRIMHDGKKAQEKRHT